MVVERRKRIDYRVEKLDRVSLSSLNDTGTALVESQLVKSIENLAGPARVGQVSTIERKGAEEITEGRTRVDDVIKRSVTSVV